MAVFMLDFISVHLSCMCHNTFFEDLAALPGAYSQFLPFAHTHILKPTHVGHSQYTLPHGQVCSSTDTYTH